MDGFRRVVSASRLMLAIVSLVSVAALVDAAPITWRGDAQIALREAAATGKPLLIEVGADWCHFCKKMEQETFSNPAIADHVRKCFVPVRIDADSDRAITKQLGVRTFPTTIVLSPQLELLASIKGFRSAQQLRSDLAAICNHEYEAQRGTGLKLSVFDRFCPVTSLDTGVPTKGYRDFHLTYRGFDLFFASEQARSQFAIQPGSYWPVADGLCSATYVDSNKATLGSWEYAVRYADRLWLFSSSEKREAFKQRPMYYLEVVRRRADRGNQAQTASFRDELRKRADLTQVQQPVAH